MGLAKSDDGHRSISYAARPTAREGNTPRSATWTSADCGREEFDHLRQAVNAHGQKHVQVRCLLNDMKFDPIQDCLVVDRPSMSRSFS
jgi:hypothetical protein